MAVVPYGRSKAIGTAVGFQAATSGAGDTILPNPRGALLVKNGSGSGITATVKVPGNDKYGQARPDLPVSVPANSSKLIGPFTSDLVDTDGYVHITYDSVTTVQVAGVVI